MFYDGVFDNLDGMKVVTEGTSYCYLPTCRASKAKARL